jgi:hypothetical protein
MVVNEFEVRGVNTIDRANTVAQILEKTRGEPILWLHGSNSVGKSTLARLITGQIPGHWLALDLRLFQDDGRAALSAWGELRRAISRDQQRGLCGILIDDLSATAYEALQRKLIGFLALVSSLETRVIVTSNFIPSPARLAELGASPNAIVQAPYFTEDEVRGLITLRDPPSPGMIDGWSRMLLVSTYGGHPMFVSAKIATLRARAWPLVALAEDLGPHTSEAVRTTREEARLRLLAELPSPEARRLLGRLGCIFDRADETLVLKLAHNEPSISNAGDALAILRGSWIELLPSGDMRLSPLIADIGGDCPPSEIMKCRETAAIHWLGGGSLNQRTLPLCFWNALLGRVTSVVARLCQALLEGEHNVATLLSPMTLLTTENSIYPEEPTVASMLRLVQFRVCDAVEDEEAAARVATRLMTEIEAITHLDFKALQTSLATQTLLLARNVSLDPAFQIELILQLRPSLQAVTAMTADASLERGLAAIVPSGDIPGFFFSSVVMRIRSSDRMLRMIEALDKISPSDRNSLIDSDAALMGSKGGAFVHSGWASEQLAGVDLKPAFERFHRMMVIARNWGRSDILVQLACAQSVILDEGLNDKVKALAVIDEAAAELGPSAFLTRQKAKVLGHAEEYAAATALIETLEDTFAKDDLFDRALCLRDGAVWARRADQFPVALRLFAKAFDALVQESEHAALAIGIKIEIALVLWAMDDRAAAVGTLAEVFEGLEQFDPSASRQNERAHQFGRAAAGLFWHQLAPFAAQSAYSIATGQPSALSGDEPLLGAELKPLSDNWRILALCELEVGADRGVDRRSIERLPPAGGLAFIEMFIAMARYCKAIVAGDLAVSFLSGSTAIAVSCISQTALAEARTVRVLEADIEKKRQQILAGSDATSEELLRRLALDILVWCRFRAQWTDTYAEEVRRVAADVLGSSQIIDEILDAAAGGTIESFPSAWVGLASRLGRNADLTGDPGARFDRDLLLVSHAASSLCQRVLEPVVVDELVSGWSSVLANEGFALRSTMIYGPMIAAAVEEARVAGLKGAARLLIAAAPAVRRDLSVAWRQFLSRLVGDAGQGVA